VTEPKTPLRRRSSPIFLTLALAFLAVGLATDNTAFTWISIAFLAVSLALNGRWFRTKRP
jgi:hypothetical protein